MDEYTVTCLCAEWCGVCREYRAGFEALASRYPMARFSWIDVEEHPEAAGEEEIETFPTLRIERGPQTLFTGPVPPQLPHLERLLDKLMT